MYLLDLLLIMGGSKSSRCYRENINEMVRALANNTLNLYHGGLQEVGDTKNLETVLLEDETTYCEQGHIVT
jgi:hypothetical protein